MEKTREQAEPQLTPGKGLKGDVERLKVNSTATAEELRAFVAGLKGRSPQEVLGIVSETGLFRGVAQATVGCIVLVAALTVLPWAFAEEQPEKAAETAATATAEPAASGAETPAATGTETAATPGQVDPAAAIRAMGEDEVKPANAAVDPLDNSLNNLLELND
jgi:hypothetical protein